ncbi:regulatory protein, luxR family [Cohaesibacter sp. ES.047]|uniref:helix-turn-helix transcriptional regulator n=1 Tax=Cohaesibacter sp. ES.047 TaxID=1798205 RepID=UPI000BB6D7AD|nr:helix-turn-helix transcriptional regulator [Cohaesibacter sp. ES.047]SNY92752.1 regulatory protein, luxR family [Cohaesibacter sp. ES.047]
MNDTLWDHPNNVSYINRLDTSPQSLFETYFPRFQAIGANHVLAAGVPLPGRDLVKLALFQKWGEEEITTGQLAQIKGGDPLLRQIAVLKEPTIWRLQDTNNQWLANSSLISLLRRSAQHPDEYRTIAGLHIHVFGHFQIALCLAGADIVATRRELLSMATEIRFALEDADAIKPILNRPGELSARERTILALTAEGRTASDIAAQLDISQRTVHAHLQNASEKMQASNKTQTVVEALRYGQIELL